jgi:ABC-type cobalamin/Fe3+-siderophores transport system ATPase subunit
VIRRVLIENFKRFDRVEFTLPGHLVVAGPNNSGKTTLLQAIAAWSVALNRWKELNDFRLHNRAYAKAPIARQAFSPVPLRAFDLLWRDRVTRSPIRITVQTDEWTLRMDLEPDSTEQIYVRPGPDVAPALAKEIAISTVLVPPMSGLSTLEPVYQRPMLDQLLGQARPGEMLRNLLLEAHGSERAWAPLQDAIRRLFGYELLPPDGSLASIVAEYRIPSGARLDVASAGSGFQQVLLLLTLLNTRPGSVLLLDEPDAHLHVILQDAILSELQAVASKQRSQLIIATHSEVVINAADLRELCLLLDRPVMIASDEQRRVLLDSLRVLSNEDIILAMQAPGVLYVEGHTEVDILRAFARVLDHPAGRLLTTELFWRPVAVEAQGGGPGVRAKDHYEALRLVKPIPALQLVDGDSQAGVGNIAITGGGFQRLRWKRYEIESYLVHPDALARFVTRIVGEAASGPHVADLHAYLSANLPPAIYARPLDDHDYLDSTKARTTILPRALSAAGLPGLPYTRYHEIAALMLPEEIHPEVVEKLDLILKAFARGVALRNGQGTHGSSDH